MIFMYFVLGLIASMLGALPLGASNIAVINTTLKQNSHQAFKIIIAAGLGEVLLSFYALHCTTVVQNFVSKNLWIQFSIATLLMMIGAYLLFKKSKNRNTNTNRPKINVSKYVIGVTLGLINPPVLIYWIVVIGFINMKNLHLAIDSPLLIVILFFVGIYLGKVATLYAYSRLSNFIKSKSKDIMLTVKKVTGVLLICIGVFQVAKLYFI